ncbi:hypothetical protein IAT38_007711 [Cryptococcus sp. DSM 104549]
MDNHPIVVRDVGIPLAFMAAGSAYQYIFPRALNLAKPYAVGAFGISTETPEEDFIGDPEVEAYLADLRAMYNQSASGTLDTEPEPTPEADVYVCEGDWQDCAYTNSINTWTTLYKCPVSHFESDAVKVEPKAADEIIGVAHNNSVEAEKEFFFDFSYCDFVLDAMSMMVSIVEVFVWGILIAFISALATLCLDCYLIYVIYKYGPQIINAMKPERLTATTTTTCSAFGIPTIANLQPTTVGSAPATATHPTVSGDEVKVTSPTTEELKITVNVDPPVLIHQNFAFAAYSASNASLRAAFTASATSTPLSKMAYRSPEDPRGELAMADFVATIKKEVKPVEIIPVDVKIAAVETAETTETAATIETVETTETTETIEASETAQTIETPVALNTTSDNTPTKSEEVLASPATSNDESETLPENIKTAGDLTTTPNTTTTEIAAVDTATVTSPTEAAVAAPAPAGEETVVEIAAAQTVLTTTPTAITTEDVKTAPETAAETVEETTIETATEIAIETATEIAAKEITTTQEIIIKKVNPTAYSSCDFIGALYPAPPLTLEEQDYMKRLNKALKRKATKQRATERLELAENGATPEEIEAIFGPKEIILTEEDLEIRRREKNKKKKAQKVRSMGMKALKEIQAGWKLFDEREEAGQGWDSSLLY